MCANITDNIRKLLIFKPALEAAAPETLEKRNDTRNRRLGRLSEGSKWIMGLFQIKRGNSLMPTNFK